MSTPNSFRNCHIVSSVKYLPLSAVQKGLSTIGGVKRAAYILHDKDTYTDAETAKLNKPELVGKLKPEHMHVVIEFNGPTPTVNITNAFGIAANFINNVNRSVPGAFEYLIHYNQPDKYLYDVKEVTATFDFEKFMAGAETRKKQRESRDAKKHDNELVDMYSTLLATGEMKGYDITAKIPPEFYARHKVELDRALNYHTMNVSKNGSNRDMTAIYMFGASGTGKTTYAKMYAEKLGVHYYLSGGNRDPLENYRGEECIILDDLRGSSFRMSELLNLLDPYTFSPISSRYHNKIPEAQLIIVTSILPLEEFYGTVFECENEPLVQLKRRLATRMEFFREKIEIEIFDKSIMDYRELAQIPNPVRELSSTNDSDILAQPRAEREKFAAKFCINDTKPLFTYWNDAERKEHLAKLAKEKAKNHDNS